MTEPSTTPSETPIYDAVVRAVGDPLAVDVVFREDIRHVRQQVVLASRFRWSDPSTAERVLIAARRQGRVIYGRMNPVPRLWRGSGESPR